MLHFCMSWTSATSIGTCATHLSRMRSLSEHPRATDLPRSYPGSFRPGRKGLSPIRLFLLLPLDSSNSFLHGLRASFASRSWRCENSFPQLEVGLFCTILVQSKSFRCNTSEPPPMCCKQRTCAIPKSRRCNTYKKHRGGGPVMVNQTSGEGCLSRATIGNEGSLFTSDCRFRPCWKAFFPRQSLGLLLTLFTTRAFHNSFPFSGIRTLSKNSRVYAVSSRSGTRHSSLATRHFLRVVNPLSREAPFPA